MPKKLKKYPASEWPEQVFLKREEDGSTRYFVCSENVNELGFEVGESATLARYVLLDTVTADAEITISEGT